MGKKKLIFFFPYDSNPRFHGCANILDPRFQATDPKRLELDLAEQKSVRELYLLLSQCCDAVYFIEFILDSNLQNILINDEYVIFYFKKKE